MPFLLSISIRPPRRTWTRADLRPQIALNPRHHGRTSASNCHSPGSADMLDTFTSRPHTRHNRATAATRRCPISVPLAPPTHFPRCNSPTTARHPALWPTQFLTHWHHNPHFTPTNPFPSPVPAHTPPPTPNRPTLQPPLKPHPDRPIQPSRPNTPTNYR